MTKFRIPKVLSGSAALLAFTGVALIWSGAVGFAPASHAGDFRRTPDYSSETSQEVNLEQLGKLLREAQELQDKQLKNPTNAQASPDAEAPAKAAPGDASKDAKSEDVAKAEKKAEAAARAGCMYRGKTLIWEKVPGSCSP